MLAKRHSGKCYNRPLARGAAGRIHLGAIRFDIRRLLRQQHLRMRTLLAFACLSGCIAPLAAQETRNVKLRAICFEHVGDLKKLYAMSGGESPKAVGFDLYTTVISEEVDAVVTNGQLVFAMAEGEVDGAPKFRTVTTARAVPGSQQLAIFIPGEPGGSPYRCFVVNDSKESFPMGSTLAINLSPAALRFSIGEHTKEVAPGKIENIPMARKANDRGQVSVIISIADAATEGGWRAVNQTRWFTGTDKRDLAIGFLNPVTGQPVVNCYADSPPQ